jgi:FtsZ-binding cell division protein ZapB
MKLLEKIQKKLNEQIISFSFMLKQIEIDELNRKYSWAKNEDSGIQGSDNNGRFAI